MIDIFVNNIISTSIEKNTVSRASTLGTLGDTTYLSFKLFFSSLVVSSVIVFSSYTSTPIIFSSKDKFIYLTPARFTLLDYNQHANNIPLNNIVLDNVL